MFSKKIGILGGGQLGKMLCLAVGKWHLDISILDPDAAAPARHFCNYFEQGDFKDYETVLQFGRKVDILTIEIEHVNEAALFQLEREGKVIHPRPSALSLIKDKGLQKEFYQKNGIPTADFVCFDDKKALKKGLETWQLPCVWKSRTGGYDGKGVSILRAIDDVEKLPDVACLLEKLVSIDKEIAVIAARNSDGDAVVYQSVEMEFDETANLLDLQLAPAYVSRRTENLVRKIALDLIEKLDICGVLAVEFFQTSRGEILVNEVAPRPHNSGHHTIEASITSQFEQHIRGILNLPLGDTRLTSASVMFNLLGTPPFEGDAHYKNFEKALDTGGVFVHRYGKAKTKPYRKMGHVNVLAEDVEVAYEKALALKKILRIEA